MITITGFHPAKRPLLFSDIEVGDLFIRGDTLYVKIEEIENEDSAYSWCEDEKEVFNAVRISGERIGELDTFEQNHEVALLKKDIKIEFDPDVDLQRWI